MLGSYPRIGEEHYRVLLTLESRDEAYLTAAVDSLLQRLPPDGVYRVGERHAQQPAVVYGGALPALVFACTAGCSAGRRGPGDRRPPGTVRSRALHRGRYARRPAAVVN